MPTTTPPRMPSPAEPNPHPTSAPAPAHMPVVPARIAPASTGWNDEREEACIRRENSRSERRLCNTGIRCDKRASPFPRATARHDRVRKQNGSRPRFILSVEAAADVPAKTRDGAALGAAGVTIVLWASAFVGIRSAGRSFSPGALSLARLTVAVFALAAIGLVRGDRLPSRGALRQVALPLLV